jgi:beta-glucosidase
MIDKLIDILTPLFIKMGASAADVSNYIHMLSGFVYALMIAFVLLIVAMIGAHFVKKGKRHIVRWEAAIAFVLTVVVIVNMICYGPMYATVSGVLNASKAEISDDVVANSKEVIKEVAEEGMVLLKNDGLLPLDSSVSALNLFGWASVHPVYCGTGSAASKEGDLATVSIIQSLTDAGYALNDELVALYTDYGKDYWGGERPTINMTSQDWSLPEPTTEYYTDSLLSNAKALSNVAVIVVGRSGGENADLPTDMHAVIKGTYNVAGTEAVQQNVAHNYNYTNATFYNNSKEYDEFDEGEHYLELSHSERNLVKTVCDNFDNVIVVVNANNVMELDWVNSYDQIKAVILAPGTGTTGMTALGEILKGEVNPSGKTADTYVKDLLKTPSINNSGNFGNNLYTNVADLTKTLARKDNTFNGVVSFVDYVEGIYQGYKYYETASDDGVISYEDEVLYPFGYGLSYTTFDQKITDFKKNKDSVTVEVTVTNTGDKAGKGVAELYYTPPYTNGGIEKASVNLIDFGKTAVLDPGASEKITFNVNLEDMASYDSEGIKAKDGGYVLEAGEYVISVRSDSHTVLDSASFTVDADVNYSKDGRTSDDEVATNRFGFAETERETLSRKDGFANYEKATAKAENFELDKNKQKEVKAISVVKYDAEDYDNKDDVMPTTGANNGLKLADLTGKSYDDAKWEDLLDELSVEDMTTLVNVGGWQTAEIKSIDKIATSDCDGPSGLSNYVTGSTGTQFPTEVLMAQTWSKEMADKIGDAMGQEFANANNFGWYGPAMNLHRSPFSGRNFEYYSEDPVLSGLFASKEVNGAAKYGVYSYIKHFAANDQETNRTAFLMTYMTEQTLRETCLKPFEIVVKNFDFNSGVLAVMSSYNWLGTKPAASCKELLTDVLRGEWGFRGMVISDYDGSYGYMITEASIRSGNDLMLGYGMADTNKLSGSATCVIAMRNASKNILYTIANSGYYRDGNAASGGIKGMTRTFIILDVSVVLAAVLINVLLFVRLAKKKKSGNAAA